MYRGIIFAMGTLVGLATAIIFISLILPRASFWFAAEPAPTVSVEGLLEAFSCHRAETKHVYLHGIEDNYSPLSDEPTRTSGRLQVPWMTSRISDSRYDQTEPDYTFLDYFEPPSQISSGLLAVRLRPIGSNENDMFFIGDMDPTRSEFNEGLRWYHEAPAAELADTPGWNAAGDVYSIRLRALTFKSVRLRSAGESHSVPPSEENSNLLQFIRAGSGSQIVEVLIDDDTSVDVLGLAVCEEPRRGYGLTMQAQPLTFNPYEDVTVIACLPNQRDAHRCDPFIGDVACHTALPVLCFRDADLEAPALDPQTARLRTPHNYWSGGYLASTPEVPGDSFAAIADVDAYCAVEFGVGWRTATYHDGGRGSQIAGYGAMSEPARPMWVDIKGQPYATCWAR
jgi:hypothetical protein